MSSASDSYFKRGLAPQTRFTMINATTTATIWSPTTSTKVVLTDLVITNNGAAQTIEIVWGNLNINDRRIFNFYVGASATITPTFGPVEGTMYDRIISAVPTAAASYGFCITASGFEIQ